MKGMTKRTLGREVKSMYDFVWRITDAERFQAVTCRQNFGESAHDHKAEAFELIRDYMIEHFRPLV